MSPFDFLNSINEKKAYLFDDVRADNSGEASDLDSVDRKYPPFMVNRGLSYFVDTVMLANEMNQRFELAKKMQYDFLYHGVRKNADSQSGTRRKKIVKTSNSLKKHIVSIVKEPKRFMILSIWRNLEGLWIKEEQINETIKI